MLAAPKDLIRRQGERAICIPLATAAALRPAGRPAGELQRARPVDDTRSSTASACFYAARRVQGNALVLMRPTSLAASAWRPHVEGLLIGALAAGVLAALAAFLLARAISRPGRGASPTRRARSPRSAPSSRCPRRAPASSPRSRAPSTRWRSGSREARAAERRFLLSVSHELKTPLTAIRGYAEMLAEDAVPEDEAADWITREATRLERLVRDLLDLGRMRRGRVQHPPRADRPRRRRARVPRPLRGAGA